MRQTARITALRLMLAGRCGHSVTPVSATGSGVPLCAVPCSLRRGKLRFFGVSLCETPKAALLPLLFPKSLATFGVPSEPLDALRNSCPKGEGFSAGSKYSWRKGRLARYSRRDSPAPAPYPVRCFAHWARSQATPRPTVKLPVRYASSAM